jgi:hypothetical protein
LRADNFGFETGTIADWTATNPYIQGGTITRDGFIPMGGGFAGTINVSTAFNSTLTQSYNHTSLALSPIEGQFLADLGTSGTTFGLDVAPGTVSPYVTSLRQSLTLSAGDSIGGWAAFYNGDYLKQDTACVRVFGSVGNLVETPWSQVSGTGATFGQIVPWTAWLFTATLSGSYTLELAVTSRGDNLFDSHGLFDGITVNRAQVVENPSPVSVPEGGLTAAMLLIAAAGLAIVRPGRRQFP